MQWDALEELPVDGGLRASTSGGRIWYAPAVIVAEIWALRQHRRARLAKPAAWPRREDGMKSRHKRLALIVGGLAALGVASALILSAFQENLVFFFSPSDVVRAEGAARTAPSASADWSRKAASSATACW